MFKLTVNSELAHPSIFAFSRRINNLEILISPEVEGFTLTDEEGEVVYSGDDRREFMQAMRNLI